MAPVLVLASASPRRALILTALGIPFRTMISHVEEDLRPGEDGTAAAERLARAKAEEVARSTQFPVLAADTVVLCDGQILGKPASAEDAARMLRLLSGRTHQVVTGVCLLAGGRAFTGYEQSDVTFAPLTEADITWYVSTGEPLDKAGAYHIDGRGGIFVVAVAGSPSNVAGLPVRLLWRLARGAEIDLGLP